MVLPHVPLPGVGGWGGIVCSGGTVRVAVGGYPESAVLDWTVCPAMWCLCSGPPRATPTPCGSGHPPLPPNWCLGSGVGEGDAMEGGGPTGRGGGYAVQTFS